MSVDYTPPTWVFKCAQGHRCEGGEAVAAEALRELAALKARRCDGCECFMVADHAIPGYGYCLLPNLRQDGPVSADLGYPVPQVRPDHACNAWMAKEPTT